MFFSACATESARIKVSLDWDGEKLLTLTDGLILENAGVSEKENIVSHFSSVDDDEVNHDNADEDDVNSDAYDWWQSQWWWWR